MLLQEASKRIQIAKASRAPILNLSELGLTAFPEEICELTWLAGIFASFNSISDLSPLCNIAELERIDLRGNRVQDLRPLSNLPRISYLDLAGNGIQDISALSSLRELDTLYLGENQITALEPLSQLSALQSLYLSENSISDIKPLQGKRKLIALDISRNQISDISPLFGIEDLVKLDISNNMIEDLGPLADSSKLRELYIGRNQIRDLTPVAKIIAAGVVIKHKEQPGPADNPLTVPPPEIVSKGNAAIANYFTELHLYGSEQLYEAKLLIVGEGGAGKTSLARKIENSANPLPHENESTMGIDVRRLNFMTTVSGKPFYLNIWDFGGQEIYHATHQFFLTHRSLYLLVDDTRKDAKNVHDEVFSYWLQVIELLGGNSPLIIVQNEKSDRSKQIDLQSMQGRFNFIKDVLPTNLATNRGLASVIDALKHWLLRLEHVGERLPVQWVQIRRELEELASDVAHISRQQYFAVCKKHGITEAGRALSLSEYLHDLGAFLHFQESILSNIVILQSKWATDAVYAVLDDEAVKGKSGFFNQLDLDRVWHDERYAHYHHVLMALMEKFELCYRLFDREETTWLAPQLLPISITLPDWDDSDNLIIRYEYDFMPKGIVPRLIVRLNHYIPDLSFAWRAGIILERQGTSARIMETYAKREIVVRVKGELPKDLVTIISEEIDSINESYKNLKVEKMIPCVCRVCKTRDVPYFFRYNNLEERIRRGKATVECERSYDTIPVQSLLDGVFTTVMGKRYEDMKVFISYSQKDEVFRRQLQNHLAALKLTQHLEVWDDASLELGDTWDATIREKIKSADIILFLISSDFISSGYIWENELPIAIERSERGDAIVIPIYLRPCDTSGLRFMELQGLPRGGKPISTFKIRDEAYTEISKGIRRKISEMRRR